MDTDRWRQISCLYHEAGARAADQRRAFLDAACGGDDALRREVESLLVDNMRAQAFLAAPKAFTDLIATDSKAMHGFAEPGMTLGSYRTRRDPGGRGRAVLRLRGRVPPSTARAQTRRR